LGGFKQKCFTGCDKLLTPVSGLDTTELISSHFHLFFSRSFRLFDPQKTIQAPARWKAKITPERVSLLSETDLLERNKKRYKGYDRPEEVPRAIATFLPAAMTSTPDSVSG
jgi:hypothetical protein